MNDDDVSKILGGLQESMRRFPKCRVASCECDDTTGEWKPGCNCPGHWRALEDAFGVSDDAWNLADAAASAKVGRPVRAG